MTHLDHGELKEFSSSYSERIIQFKEYKENPLVVLFREIIHTAHYQWLWSEAVKYYWGRHNDRVGGNIREKIKLHVWRMFGFFFAFRPMLRFGTKIERWLSWKLRPTRYFDDLFNELNSDLVFNCSHIHGTKADLPMRVAAGMGIPTAVFIFSWDNLTSRSRIFPPYDHYLLWNKKMADQLIELYSPEINIDQVHITGSPQFDFHFNPKFYWEKQKLYNEIGLDINRPYILYTTGMASDFHNENSIVEKVIEFIKELEIKIRPQIVIRTYIKGTSKEMLLLADKYKNDSDVFFPPILWDPIWVMPLNHDLYVYTNLIRYTNLGINAASTVSLELMMFKKIVINIGFEPPGSDLPDWCKFSRHIDYDHYRPLVISGGVIVAKSIKELNNYIFQSLGKPNKNKSQQEGFIAEFFDKKIDRSSASRMAEVLSSISKADNSV